MLFSSFHTVVLMITSNHQHHGMEGTKFLASQAKSIYHYKSIRSKVLKFNADILFNNSNHH